MSGPTTFRYSRLPPIQGGIIAPDGKLISSTLEAHIAADRFERPRSISASISMANTTGFYISKPLIGRMSDRISIQVSQRVELGRTADFLGVVVFSLAPGQLTTLHKSIDLGPRGMVALIGTDDQIIRARFTAGSENGDLGAGEQVPPACRRRPT